jgi:hypothetical protein
MNNSNSAFFEHRARIRRAMMDAAQALNDLQWEVIDDQAVDHIDTWMQSLYTRGDSRRQAMENISNGAREVPAKD